MICFISKKAQKLALTMNNINSMSEFKDFAQRIQQYLETDGSGAKNLADELTQSKLSNKQILSLLWSFLSLSKSASLFNANSTNLICMVLYEIAEINSDFTNLLYITLDKSDLDRINVDNSLIDKNSFNKSLKLSNSKKFNITKYQYMEKNPEGFACLLLALMKNRADDLTQIIGEHNLDPDSVLLILIDLIGFKNAENTKKFYDMLPKFNVNRTINMLVRKIDQNYMPGHIRILFSLFDSGMIPIEKQIPILSHLSSVLEKLQSLLSEAADDFCEFIRKPRTVIPGEPKHSKNWLLKQKQYLDARDTLYKSPHFRIEFSTIEIDKIFEYAQYDPCSIPALAEYVTNYLLKSIEEDSSNFFNNEINMRLIPILTCHCTSNILIKSICNLNEIPAHIFVNFILPAMSMNSCGWQLSEIVFEKMSSLFTFSERCQIYRRLDSVYNTIIDLRVLAASAQGKIANIMKRVTTTNNQNSYRFSKLLIKAPHIASNALITYIKDNKPTPPVEVLLGLLCDSSRFAIDIIFWRFTDAVENVQYESKSEIVMLPPALTLWPKFIGEFLGKLASMNFHSLDLEGYLDFIVKGLRQHKIANVCLLSYLLSEITGIRYNDKMTKEDIEIRSGESLQRIMRLIDSKDDNQHIDDEFKTILLSEKNNYALNILCSLDSMHKSLNFIYNMPDNSIARDRVDDIQSTFLSLCEFLESNNWNPTELVNRYHFTYPSSFHISRENYEIENNDVESLMPEKIPIDLFSIFWKHGLKDLHYPKEKFKKKIADIEELISKENEEGKLRFELLKDKIKENKKNQKQKVADFYEKMRLINQDWFNEELNENIYDRFAHYCVMKRIIISQIDPVYTAKFVFLLSHMPDTQFDLKKFMIVFLKYFHFNIFSRTINESNLIGVFVKKILKKFNDQGDIESIEEIHSLLMKKVALLFQRKETMFVIANTINFLNTVQVYFPSRTEHKNLIIGQLKQIDLPDGSDVKLLVRRYLANVEKMLKDKKPSRPPSPPPLKPLPAFSKQNNEKEEENDNNNDNEKTNEEEAPVNDENRTDEAEDDKADGVVFNEEEQINENDNEQNDEQNDEHLDEDVSNRSNETVDDENNEEEQVNENDDNNNDEHEDENEDDGDNRSNETVDDENNEQPNDDDENENENDEPINENDEQNNENEEQRSVDDEEAANNEINEEEQQAEENNDADEENKNEPVIQEENEKQKEVDDNKKSDDRKERDIKNDRSDQNSRNDRTPIRPLSKPISPSSHHNNRDQSGRNDRNDRNGQNLRSDNRNRINRNDRIAQNDRNIRGDSRDRDQRVIRSGQNDRNDRRYDRNGGSDRIDGINRDRDRMNRMGGNDSHQQPRMRSQSDRYPSQSNQDYKNYNNYGNRGRPTDRSYSDSRRRNNDK